jgi:hypothetical protein
MPGIAQLFQKVATAIKGSPRQSPSTITIPRNHIDENLNGALDKSFKKDEHYFEVVINEMYLMNARNWLRLIDPVVFVVSEFTYDGKQQVTPFLVGPSLLKDKGIPDQLARGMIFRNTSASRGPRVYRGGSLTLSIVLCEAEGDNVLRPMLRVIETAAAALDFSPVLGPYLKVANVVMDGFESLFNSNGVLPLVGLRDSYGPNFAEPLRTSYFALLDLPNVDARTLWVRGKQLWQGASFDAAQPYRSSDYVLYSITGAADNARDDTDTLPFFAQWQEVKQLATSRDTRDWESAAIAMAGLAQSVLCSPDLTDNQASELVDKYRTKMETLHRQVSASGHLGEADMQNLTSEQKRRVTAREASIDMLRSLLKPQ